MRNPIFLLFIFSTIAFKVTGQLNTPIIFKELFQSLQANDKNKFVTSFLSSGDYIDILTAYYNNEVEIKTTPTTNINSVPYTNYLKDTIFVKLKQVTDSLNINLTKSTYINCGYTIINEPATLLPSLTGHLYFKYEQSYFELEITEALYIHDNWKISKLGEFKIVNDTAFFSTKEINKISAFNSITTKNEIIEIKLSEIKVTGNSPPPPPPFPSKKKRH